MDVTRLLIAQALQLPEDQRHGLIDELFDSFDAPATEAERAWVDVAKDRLGEIRRGEVQTLSAEEVDARSEARLAQARLERGRDAPPLRDQLLALPYEDRALAARELAYNLEHPNPPSHERAWAAEIARRVQEVKDGTAVTVPMDEALARIRADLAEQRKARELSGERPASRADIEAFLAAELEASLKHARERVAEIRRCKQELDNTSE